MLISHRKQFIFTKTVKTAGTSVESYFERYCMFEGEWKPSHEREVYVSEAGIVGFRGAISLKKNKPEWFHHMPAKAIRDKIGKEIFNSYFKFTVIRNPFDKLISAFYFASKLNSTPMSNDVRKFRLFVNRLFTKHFIRKQKNPNIDRNKYLINGQECVDFYIRYENLHKGIRHVCNHLSIPFEPQLIPSFKSEIRNHDIAIKDFYNRETINKVMALYSWEIKRFGYTLPS